MEKYVPNFDIEKYAPEWKGKVRDLVINLKNFYPMIEEWLEKELNRLEKREDSCWMIVDDKRDVVGVAISGLEKEGIAKLKTFYLSKDFEGYAIGVPLLKKVLNFWIEKKIRNIFVTFAEEELEKLRGFFDKFGFVMDGMMPQYYRPGKTEYVMSKTFIYDEIDENSFEDFIRNYLLRMRGIVPDSEGSEFFAREDNRLSKTPRKIFIKIIKEKNAENSKLFEYMNLKINESKSVYGILISYYPLLEISEDERIKVIDGYLLENIFFPLRLRREGHSGIILPIDQHYAKGLLNMEEPQRRITKERLTLTHERAYFTGKNDFSGVSRGGVFFFYLMKGDYRDKAGIIGEAKIKILSLDKKVEDAIKEFGNRGVILTEQELRKFSNKGRVSIFLLTHVKEYPNKIGIDEIRAVLPDADFRCQPVIDLQIDRIRKLGGDGLQSY